MFYLFLQLGEGQHIAAIFGAIALRPGVPSKGSNAPAHGRDQVGIVDIGSGVSFNPLFCVEVVHPEDADVVIALVGGEEHFADVVEAGAVGGVDAVAAGIDDLETLALVPDTFSGYVWTNRIERIGPALRDR